MCSLLQCRDAITIAPFCIKEHSSQQKFASSTISRSWERKMPGHRTMWSPWFSLAEMMTSSPRFAVFFVSHLGLFKPGKQENLWEVIQWKWLEEIHSLSDFFKSSGASPDTTISRKKTEVVPDVEGYREVMQRYREEKHSLCHPQEFQRQRLVWKSRNCWLEQSSESSHPVIPSLKLTVRTWKWMVGILVSFWDGLFSGASC